MEVKQFDQLVDRIFNKSALIELVWQSMPLAVCVADTEHHLIAINPALEECLQRSSKEVAGLNFVEELVHPDDRQRTEEAYQKALQLGPESSAWATDGEVFENRYQRKDGSYVTLVWLAASRMTKYQGRKVYLNLAKIKRSNAGR